MKMKFGIRLLIVLLVAILIMNITFSTNVRARDNYAYIVASSYYFDSAADYVRSKLPFWYGRLKYNVGTDSDPTPTEFWESLYADVQYLYGHGDWDRFWTKNVGLIVGDGRKYDGRHHFGTNDVHWDTDTILVVYAACKTAENLEDGLAVETCRSGADNVIGWRNPIWSDHAAYWGEYFAASVATGLGVYDAAANANSKSYPGDDENDGHSIKNNVVVNRGDANMKLGCFRTNAKQTETNIIEDGRNILKNTKQSIEFKSIDELLDIIKAYDSTFNKENYTITQSDGLQTINIVTGEETKQLVIDLNLKLDDFYTNAGYVITISNGKVEAIYDNTLPLKNRKVGLSNSNFKVDSVIKNNGDIYLEKAKAEVIEKTINDGILNYNIIEQKKTYYYDVETDKKYVRVRTIIENEHENGNSRDYITSLYEI